MSRTWQIALLLVAAAVGGLLVWYQLHPPLEKIVAMGVQENDPLVCDRLPQWATSWGVSFSPRKKCYSDVISVTRSYASCTQVPKPEDCLYSVAYKLNEVEPCNLLRERLPNDLSDAQMTLLARCYIVGSAVRSSQCDLIRDPDFQLLCKINRGSLISRDCSVEQPNSKEYIQCLVDNLNDDVKACEAIGDERLRQRWCLSGRLDNKADHEEALRNWNDG